MTIAGSGGCFLGHTLVRVPDGQRRIDELEPGDLVLSFDDRGAIHEAEVLKVHAHEGERVVRYRIWGGGLLDATPNHWVLNQFNAFVQIGTLGADDCLVDENGHLRPIVDRSELCVGTVYNLTVEGHHTFIAGGIRVHNAGLGAGRIAGAGGGKGSGGSSSPDTEEDGLDSKAYAKIVDLIGEGEIEGFPSARTYTWGTSAYNTAMLKDFYFNKTQVLRSSADPTNAQKSDYNFKGVTVEVRRGTQNQDYIPGFASAEREVSVGLTVTESSPVTRTITDTDVDRARVTLTWGSLQQIQSDGDIVGVTVKYKIQVSYNGGAFQTVVEKKIQGRSGDQYQRDHAFSLTGPFPVDIRVIRDTNDSTDPKRADSFSWTSYTEITDAKLRYPNSALVAIQVNAKNFNAIPTRSYRLRGLKIRIPSNATVDQSNGRLIYSGTWDGTFAAATWCADPAWCLWDLLTNCRYGFGQYIKSRNLDKWSFYQASVYCNELVPSGEYNSDGTAVMEPRFLCNVNIQSSTEAYKLINDMCSVFRAMPFWSAGSLTIAQDRPAAPSYVFNQTNVSEEGFQYSGSSLKTRHTVAVVGYLDLDEQELAYEAVEDPNGIARYGVVQAEVTAFACTSRSQAHRVGEWLLYTEQNETETVTFKTSLDAGAAVRPGMTIRVSDPLRAGARRGGRITASGSNYIVVDERAATDLPTTGSPFMHVAMADGTVETPTVASVSGTRITINGTFTSTPLVGGSFIYNNDNMKASSWRVLSVQEEDGSQYTITALAYNGSKFDYVERGTALYKKNFLPLSVQAPSDPQNVSTEVVAYESNGQLQNKLIVGWQSDPTASTYEVRYRLLSQEVV